MPFQEKSSWIMTFALLLGAAFYARIVAGMSAALGHLAPPGLPALVSYTVLLVVIAIVGHIVVAALAARDANAPLDERERLIVRTASHLSGYVFGSAVMVSLGLYLLHYNGDALFYCVFASLMLGQCAEYVARIVLFRRAL